MKKTVPNKLLYRQFDQHNSVEKKKEGTASVTKFNGAGSGKLKKVTDLSGAGSGT
jgi:hypothetical protein